MNQTETADRSSLRPTGARVLETRRGALPAARDAATGPTRTPRPFRRGFGEFTRFYGMLLDTLDTAYPNGFSYTMMSPAAPEEVPARIQRAQEVFDGRLWREQLREWDEVVKPASIATHREIQSVDPDALSDEELAAYLTRCHEHHAAMITQHMRFTAAAMIPTGDFLAHAGAWTGLPPSDLLGLLRGARTRLGGRVGRARAARGGHRRGRAGPCSCSTSDGDPARGAGRTARARRRRRSRGERLPRPRRLAAARRLRHLRAVRARAAGCAAAGDPRGRRGARRRGVERRGADGRRAREGPRRSTAASSTSSSARRG